MEESLYKVIPVVVINDVKDTIPTMQALVDGGLPVAEITFRTDCAEEAIKLAVSKFPDMYIGAGTVINLEQCKKAAKAGAKFIVSPGLDNEVAKYCLTRKLPYYPGVVTPTEIMRAVALGLKVVKFFPANVFGGLKALKALAGPFPKIKFLPTGGADLTNLKEFLECDKVYAVGGSFMMKGDIVDNCKKINEIIKEVESKECK